MRIAAYVGTSAVLAASVLLRAAYERPNFYSACVYLSQSNACLMIVTNLVLILTASFMFGLQRLLYGPLRITEVERLCEHAWFAVTETLLAMTIFRDDVGVRFFVMFVSLIAGKIWQWIGAGRVVFVEQQPPDSRETFFHCRLLSSLLLSIAYDMIMLGYCVNTVLQQARPNMIVMFGFEYAILLIESFATTFRHIFCLVDLTIQSRQLEAKRQDMIQERQAERQRLRIGAGGDGASEAEVATDHIEIDDNEIDVPGWEGKGRWIFYLDLTKDFAKLAVYLAFFVILMTFHGLPIHIMRDVLLTFRSFHKRIHDFVRYRNATRDMNALYPDATIEELGENNICIICREEMRPWTAPAQERTVAAADDQVPRNPQRPIDERHRAKKLPCGHCLHISCLRSWLERQQACPTCRQPVLVERTLQRQQANHANPLAHNGAGPGPGQRAQNAAAQDANAQQPLLPRMRQIQFGPFRIGYGVRAVNLNNAQIDNLLAPVLGPMQQQQQQQQQRTGLGTRSPSELLRRAIASPSLAHSAVARSILMDQMESSIAGQIQALNIARHQVHLVRALQAEYLRLRRVAASTASVGEQPAQDEQSALASMLAGMDTAGGMDLNDFLERDVPHMRPFRPRADPAVMRAQDPNLPQGLTLPPDWSFVPLHRVGTANQDADLPSAAAAAHSVSQSAAEATASLHNWNDTMSRALERATNRIYAAPDAPARAMGADEPGGVENPQPGYRETIPRSTETTNPHNSSSDAMPPCSDTADASGSPINAGMHGNGSAASHQPTVEDGEENGSS